MRTCATCRKFKVCEFSPSAESLFKSFPMSYIMFGQKRFVQNILVLGQLVPILFCPKMFRPKSFSPPTLCSHTSFVQMIFVPLFLVHIPFSPM